MIASIAGAASGESIDVARDIAAAVHEIADMLRHTVVELRSAQGGGAGIIWGDRGLIVTNAHCVPRGASLEVATQQGRCEGRVISHAREHDLALIAAPVAAPPLELRDAESLSIGELLFAHGHPLGMRDSLAMGVMHGVARHRSTGEPRYIVADVRLAPGNSGGPLVDARGRLVGVNSMVVDGLGVAVPARVVARFVERVARMRAA